MKASCMSIVNYQRSVFSFNSEWQYIWKSVYFVKEGVSRGHSCSEVVNLSDKHTSIKREKSQWKREGGAYGERKVAKAVNAPFFLGGLLLYLSP